MCNPITDQVTIQTKPRVTNQTKSTRESIFDNIWPLPLPLVLVALPLLPKVLYVNRGYTVWFHLTSIVYFLTRSPFVRKVLLLMGTGICLGWYSAILHDVIAEGTFCHTLYRNMPNKHSILIKNYDDNTYVMLENDWSCVVAKVVAHVLDLAGHPGLLYGIYWCHQKAGGRLRDVASWDVIGAAWFLSRSWSMFHSYKNQGVAALWYYGHDIYDLSNLDCYRIAYVAEAIFFGVATWHRLYQDGREAVRLTLLDTRLSMLTKEDRDSPRLAHSESAVSTSSSMLSQS